MIWVLRSDRRLTAHVSKQLVLISTHWPILHLKACFQIHAWKCAAYRRFQIIVWKATIGYNSTIKSMSGPPMTALAFSRTISDEIAMWTAIADVIFLGHAPVRACYTKTIGLRTSATLLALCVMYVCVRVAMWLLMKCVHTAWNSESPDLPCQSLQLLEP
jgi:hypothetical protein